MVASFECHGKVIIVIIFLFSECIVGEYDVYTILYTYYKLSQNLREREERHIWENRGGMWRIFILRTNFSYHFGYSIAIAWIVPEMPTEIYRKKIWDVPET